MLENRTRSQPSLVGQIGLQSALSFAVAIAIAGCQSRTEKAASSKGEDRSAAPTSAAPGATATQTASGAPLSGALRAAWIRATQEAASAHYAWQSNARGLVASGEHARFALAGGTLEMAPAEGESWKLSLATRSVGREGAPRASARGEVTREQRANGARLERGAVVERWLHGPLGVEHLYELPKRPAGEGALVIEIEVSGLRAVERGESEALLADAGGVARARYSDLFVHDADKRVLPARLEVTEGGARVRLRVEDGDARYPVVIDPLLALEEALLEGPGGATDDLIGLSVAISADGLRAIVGAPYDEVGMLANAGSARVFVRAGSTWTHEQTLVAADAAANDNFAFSVALSSDASRALIGVPQDDYSLPPNRTNAGTVRVFLRTGTTWAPEQELRAPTPANDDQFGFSVALAPNANRALIGAPFDDVGSKTDAGSVHVFDRTTLLSHQQVLEGAAIRDTFGISVALSSAADRAVVGAPGFASPMNVGSVHSFLRGASVFAEEGQLTATTAADDLFGFSVALSSDASRAIVGSPFDDVGAVSNAGSASVFLRSGSSWTQEGALLTATGAAAKDHFGTAVALSSGAELALVGAPAVEFTLPIVTATGTGSVRPFLRSGTTWTQQSMITALGAQHGDAFGAAVAIATDGTRAIFGAPGDDATATNSGSARVFTLAITLDNGVACMNNGQCGSGWCVDSVCCATECAGGTNDCQACNVTAGGTSNGTCTALSAAFAPTITCRGSAGVCDQAEVCSSGSPMCPADGFAMGGTECRASAGVCDAAEACTGSSAACPADGFASSGTECRASAGVCDAAEACTGSSAACPADGFASSGTECRASAGVCDAAEACTGSSPSCPGDTLVATGTLCRGSAGLCDVAEACNGVAVACPADGFASGSTECRASAGVCDVAESCTGSTAACPADGFEDSSTVCRASAGDCDVAESCTGGDSACPEDAFAAASTSCRASSGACDLAETCTGVTSACPPDQLAAAGVECRGSAGACDVSETCDGASGACPDDGFTTAGTECRATSGECDVAENCTGGDSACPADGFVAMGTSCRPSEGDCDQAETCDGSSGACPANLFATAGTPCRDASCMGGSETEAASCTGSSSSCPDPVVSSCEPYLCGPMECGNTCTTDAECTSSSFCSAAMDCEPDLPNGEGCTANSQCISGTCASGVCGAPVAAVPALGNLGALGLGALLLLAGVGARRRRA